MNHTRFPKEDHLPDRAHRDKQGKKGDHVKELWWVHTLELHVEGYLKISDFNSPKPIYIYTLTDELFY